MALINISVLQKLVDDHDRLVTRRHTESASKEQLRRLEDVYYTLCVYTDVREPRAALAEARRLLRENRARPQTTV